MDHMDHMDLAQLAIRRLIVAEAYHEHQLNEILPARGEPARVDAEREPRDVIVVGCDGSPGSRIAAHWAAEEARLLGRTLRLVSVWRRHLSLQPPLAGEDAAEIETAAWGTLEEVAGQLRASGYSAAQRVIEGEPGPCLVQEAENAGLLVVGSRSRGKIRSTLLGSVGRYCIRHAPCPVVVVGEGAVLALGGPTAAAAEELGGSPEK